jgi:hypothetical protein
VRRLVSAPGVVAMLALATTVVPGLASTAGAAPLPVAASGSPATPVTSAVAGVPVVGSAVGSLLGAPQGPATAPASQPGAARVASASPALAVNPDTDLTNGETVTVTASGMHANAYGSVLECNLAKDEPTVQVEGNAVPVGCTNPLQTITSTDGSGGFTKSFVVRTGTIGPPAQGTDSAGNPASADAAKYPCPPTPAQQAAGTTCDIVYGDTAGDQATTPLQFATGATPDSVAVGGGSGTAAPAGLGTASSTSGRAGGGGGTGASGTLAFTGAGSGMAWLAGTGLALLATGTLLTAAIGLRRRRRAAPSSC